MNVRLTTLFNKIGYVNTLVDCGTDHGILPVEAVRKGKCRLAIAADISPKSLEKARKLAEYRRCTDKMQFVCADGIAFLDTYAHSRQYTADLVVIAGLGSEEIISILTSANTRHRRYLLLPHQHSNVLRRYLLTNGYGIISDVVIEENHHFYHCIEVEHGDYAPQSFEYYYGKDNSIQCETFAKYVEYRLKSLTQCLGHGSEEEQRAYAEEYELLLQLSK